LDLVHKKRLHFVVVLRRDVENRTSHLFGLFLVDILFEHLVQLFFMLDSVVSIVLEVEGNGGQRMAIEILRKLFGLDRGAHENKLEIYRIQKTFQNQKEKVRILVSLVHFVDD
jgi:hypothetical protein